MKIFTMDPENLYLKEKTFQLQSSEFSRTLEQKAYFQPGMVGLKSRHSWVSKLAQINSLYSV